MKLLFTGHDQRYAVEQSLLAFFPQERPVYEPDAADENRAEVRLSLGKTYATATTLIRYEGREGRGVSRVRIDGAADEYQRERLRQRAVKLSFFKAARAVTGQTPAWGALTGIRPGKLAGQYLAAGKTPAQVDRILRDTYCVSAPR
ncbi:MAG: coproporphyrinogen dehydrogenase HemZ, partial [Oscillospiraceae bacterium]|nr:coproporphyrinogen dehydrogenase HemZ [Oscillospiraceae bacterium]